MRDKERMGKLKHEIADVLIYIFISQFFLGLMQKN